MGALGGLSPALDGVQQLRCNMLRWRRLLSSAPSRSCCGGEIGPEAIAMIASEQASARHYSSADCRPSAVGSGSPD